MGCHPQAFLSDVDPLLDGIREKLWVSIGTSDALAGHLAPAWAEKMGLRAGIPIPVGAFDAHWDAIGAGMQTRRCGQRGRHVDLHHGHAAEDQLIPGVCGVVPGACIPRYTGIEAGLSATGDIFEAIARRAGVKVAELSRGLENYRRGTNRPTAVELGQWGPHDPGRPGAQGDTLGWNLVHTAQDELFAAIEGASIPGSSWSAWPSTECPWSGYQCRRDSAK